MASPPHFAVAAAAPPCNSTALRRTCSPRSSPFERLVLALIALSSWRDMLAGVRIVSEGEAAGLKIVARGADHLFARGVYELPIQTTIAANLAPGDVFYDIGANVGFFSLIAARNVGARGQVYAFEPVPANAKRVMEAARLNHFDSIDVLEMAVGASGGRADLVLARHIGGAALASAEMPPDASGQISVRLMTVDDAIEAFQLRQPNLVKVDVEGAELDVFHGMARTIAAAKPTIIYEVDDRSDAGLKRKVQTTAAFLISAGYRLEILPAAYPDGDWHVAHLIARPLKRSELAA